MVRKSPVRHGVSGYAKRDGTRVPSYPRGSGSRQTKPSRVVGGGSSNIGIDFSKGRLTEREINLIKNRLSGSTGASDELIKETSAAFYDNMPDYGYPITGAQTDKGLTFLRKYAKKNDWGYRENAILDNFSHFTVSGFHNIATPAQSRYGMKPHVIDYTVHDKEGDTFDYYYSGGKVNITG